MTTHEKLNNWEQEFDEKFVNSMDSLTRWGNKVKNRHLKKSLKENELKDFIRSLLASHTHDSIEEVKRNAIIEYLTKILLDTEGFDAVARKSLKKHLSLLTTLQKKQ